MRTRLTFNVSGENFNAQKCINELNSNELTADFEEEYPNHLSFIHPSEFAEYWDEDYEKAYLDFIITNIAIFSRNGADNFFIFTEMYIQNDEQCNFEVLSSGFRPYIWKYDIGLPVSVYTVEDEAS